MAPGPIRPLNVGPERACVSVRDPVGHLRWHEKVNCAGSVRICFHLREPLGIVFRQDFGSIGNKREWVLHELSSSNLF